MRASIAFLIVAASCSPALSHSVSAHDASVAAAEHVSNMSVPGCYTLQDGAWARDSLVQSFYPARLVPRDIRLDTLLLRDWDALQEADRPLFAVHTGKGDGSLFTYWQRDRAGSDSLTISSPLPYRGAYLRVHSAAGGLAGSITTFTDAIPINGAGEATAPVFLARVSCP